ncbi:MAG: hypothetical protein MJ233_03760 [Mycoplasmoidaceae bacterium]|nr:hypothetical protein [Mycoplasmoidaceae bacterium]
MPKYQTRLANIKQLKQDGYYPLIAILDQYLGNDPYIASNTPNSIDFGSYHMGTGSLTGTFEYSKETTDKQTCFGFNFCNGPEINYPRFSKESCYDVEKQELTLPTYKDPATSTDPITKLAPQAFDNTQSNAYNIGLPVEIQKIIVPEQYVEIGARAITGNESFGESQLTNITFERGSGLNPCKLGASAFYNLPNVTIIDLSSFKTNDYLRFGSN